MYRVFSLKVDRILIWIIYLLRFTTCYVTHLAFIYSKCWRWCPFISVHLSTRFTMFLETFLSVLSFTSSMARVILIFSCFVSRIASINSVFQVNLQKEVWTSKIRGSWWPHSFRNYVFTDKFMQNVHSRGSSMSSCTVLLEPTVTFSHLQQCDELLDKFLVGFSI